MTISDEDIEAAVDYLRDNAEAAALAYAEAVYLENYRQVVKAEIMRENLDKPVNAQEREAYADDRYKVHLGAMRVADYEAKKYAFLMKAAEAKIDAWQTFSANSRPKI